MDNKEKWEDMYKASQQEVWEFNDFSEDKAIIWANNQIENYKKAMMYLVRGNSDWAMFLTDEQEDFVATMVRRAEV